VIEHIPPREIIDTVPRITAEEMHRCKNRGFCCGAGGARMWLEERTGKRISTERVDEAPADRAPLRWWRVFPGEDRQLRVMREWLRSLLPACMARDDVIAVASELGANAVRHTRSGQGGQFSIEVTWDGSVVIIVAGDSGGLSQPRVIDDLESENGRGLRLVRSLSLTVEVTGDERGRFVRADVPWTADRRSKPHELAWARETAADLRML
jgi:anti-sigma regulatory factor (Ser/Thr protein kinase)